LLAKRETNALIGDYYRAGDTIRILAESATNLRADVPDESVDYIYTDPPYGAHIAYLDLSTMWHAWLGFDVTDEDRASLNTSACLMLRMKRDEPRKKTGIGRCSTIQRLWSTAVQVIQPNITATPAEAMRRQTE